MCALLQENVVFCTINEGLELRLISRQNSKELLALIEFNREHLRQWHPWVDGVRTISEVEQAIESWHRRQANKEGVHAGIWADGRFCGMINFLTIDWSNRWAALSYWLDEAHQGHGIMTACCHAMICHGFNTWGLNRITIECAPENTRSCAIPERLGFKLDGVVRGIEWLHDRYVNHAMYGLLRSDYPELVRSAFVWRATTKHS